MTRGHIAPGTLVRSLEGLSLWSSVDGPQRVCWVEHNNVCMVLASAQYPYDANMGTGKVRIETAYEVMVLAPNGMFGWNESRYFEDVRQ